MNSWRGTVKKFSLLLFLALGFSSLSLSLSGSVSAYDFSVTIPEGEILEVKLFNSDGVAMGSTTSMNVAPSSLSSAGFNEKNVIVSVATSNEWGYNLVMNIPNTNLVSKEDSSNTIPTLAPKDGGYTCTIQTATTCDFTVNHWGYKINTNTTTQTATNYLPIPTTINLNSLDTVTTGDTTSISFGSRINASQTPGTYQATITFAVTATPRPIFMQTVTDADLLALMPNSGDSTTIPDKRDGTEYQITNINGTYWMTDNLKIMGTISASDSNFTGADFNISAGGDLTAGNTYTEPRAHYNTSDPNSATYGAYYNYCAASAGTVCSDSITQSASSDICPAGWRLPTTAETRVVANASGANWNPVIAGAYTDGALGSSVASNWWTATASGLGRHNRLFTNPSLSPSWNADSAPLLDSYGISLRCVYNSQLTYMQDMTNAKLAELMPSNGNITTLYDKRDKNDYQITNMNGTYWMTQNLRFIGIAPSSLSNFTGNNFNVSAGDLTSGDSYIEARAHYDYSPTDGAYYNYCSASAGTICSDTAQQNATSDICPAGWRLPNNSELQVIADNQATNWNPIAAGIYLSGSLSSKGSLYSWWGSEFSSVDPSFQVRLMKSNSVEWRISWLYRSAGLSVRCVFNAPLPMQSVTSANLATLMPNNGDTATLYDSRDNTTYTIGKLADGNYWMLDNLALDLTDSTVVNNLSPTNTNASAASLISLKSGNRAAGDQYATAGLTLSDWTSGGSVTEPLVNTQYKDDLQPLISDQTQTGKSGVYYNTCAAFAGSFCYDGHYSPGSANTSVTEDICPINWKIPKYDDGDFNTLKNQYNSDAEFVLALRVPLAGNLSAGSRIISNRSHTYTADFRQAYAGGPSITRGTMMITWNSQKETIVTTATGNFRAGGSDAGNTIRCVFSAT